MFREIKSGLSNLWKWFPVVWNNREWDHQYLLIILRKKLELMEENFRTRSHCTDGDKQADKIKYTILLLNRLIEDDYWEKKNGDYLRKQDLDALFKHIRKHLESWWD